MTRMARLVVPHHPHHITQRGNRRQRTFFGEEDFQTYFDLLVEAKRRSNVQVWAYCFMPNHVHLVVVPDHKDGLSQFFREAHRQYTLRVNSRYEWTGHLWQERFHSFVMDENHLLSAVRYTELNPVRAKLCENATDWRWSSARAHLLERDDKLVSVIPMLQRVGDWRNYLGIAEQTSSLENIRLHSRTGRPQGDTNFVDTLEVLMKRKIHMRKSGPKRKGLTPEKGDN